MSAFLYICTHGSNEPTLATLPFAAALGALDAGHEVAIVLVGEGSHLVHDYIISRIYGVGLPPLLDLFAETINSHVPVYISQPCARARGITDRELEGNYGKLVSMRELAELTAAADQVVSF